MTDRSRLHDLDAERAVLGASLLDNGVLDRLADLTPAHFFRDAHVKLYAASQALHAAGTPVDLLTLRAYLTDRGQLDDVGGAVYITKLIDGVPHSSNVEAYARIVIEKAEQRLTVAALERATAAAIANPASDAWREVLPISPRNEKTDRDKRTGRAIQLTAASSIAVRPVHWLWKDRLALGTFGLLAGREGTGKTAVSTTLAADITRGRLAGVHAGTPRSVIIAATEDSWEHTLVPRLMAAGANLTRVFRVDVETGGEPDSPLSLPNDLAALAAKVREVGAALVILDPLISRLDGRIDSHKDADVRRALEPLAALAHATDTCVLGLIHVSKSSSNDPLTLLMGSRAFAAVARAVLFVQTDTEAEDQSTRLLGQVKNNLGRCDLPSLMFKVIGTHVADTPEGPVFTGKVHWLGESDRTVGEAIENAATNTGDRTATSEAMDWLNDFMSSHDGSVESAQAKRAGQQAGHSADALKRARRTLGITSISSGFPRRTVWALQSAQTSGHTPTAPTAPTAPTTTTTTTSVGAVGVVSAVSAVGQVPPTCTNSTDDKPSIDWGHKNVSSEVPTDGQF